MLRFMPQFRVAPHSVVRSRLFVLALPRGTESMEEASTNTGCLPVPTSSSSPRHALQPHASKPRHCLACAAASCCEYTVPLQGFVWLCTLNSSPIIIFCRFNIASGKWARIAARHTIFSDLVPKSGRHQIEARKWHCWPRCRTFVLRRRADARTRC